MMQIGARPGIIVGNCIHDACSHKVNGRTIVTSDRIRPIFMQQQLSKQKRRRCARQQNHQTVSAIPVAQSEFDIPAAPILLPKGPWKAIEGSVNAPKGFKAQGMAGGLRASGPKADLALIVADADAVAAGVFTTNVMCAAPVLYCKKVLAKNKPARAVLINAGQANAATGDAGYEDSVRSAEAVAQALGIESDQVLIESTGVIGRRIKLQALLDSVPKLVSNLGPSAEDAHHAAVGITTTDLVSKSAAIETEILGKKVRVGGIAKGSGMIHPNMATLLSVITTDANVEPSLWHTILLHGVQKSFNQITVDGDTSTNDTCIGLASGAAANDLIKHSTSEAAQKLEAAVTALLQGLAKSIAWDGEGATCLLEVTALGAPDDRSAAKIAKSIAASSLTKAAIFGHDPNWGRIACAAGYSGVKFNQNNLRVKLGDIALMDGGQPLEFDAKAASKYLTDVASEHGTCKIEVSVGNDHGHAQAWGCDLSYKYVEINAEYTT